MYPTSAYEKCDRLTVLLVQFSRDKDKLLEDMLIKKCYQKSID